MPNTPDTYSAEPPVRSDPAVDLINFPDGGTMALPAVSRAIRAAGAGTLEVVMKSGRHVTAHFTAGETRNLRVTEIDGGTATGVEVMF